MVQGRPTKERVSHSRERARMAGLRRVEVLVPEDKADLVRAYAAQLREGTQSERLREVRQLISKAYERHYSQCLDNIRVDPEKADFGDAAVVAAALMHRGGAAAYKLGRQIRGLVK